MKRICIVLFVCIGYVSCFAQHAVIKGKIIPLIPEEAILITKKTKVILEINGIEKSTSVDKDLNFSFYNLESDSIRIRLEPPSYMRHSIIIGFLKPYDTLDIKMPYALSCSYDKSEDNKTCPVCKKEDRVIVITYGLIGEITKKGEEKTEKEYKPGGCVITDCDPNWHCKRDNIDF